MVITLPEPGPSDGVVALRTWRPGDVPSLVAACQDPEIPRWTTVPRPYGEANARQFVAVAADRMRQGAAAPLAIVDARDGSLLGATGLNAIDWELGAADVGYWVAASARRRGVATRALDVLAGWGFDTLGLVRLELRAHRENVASQAVARRAGFAAVAVPLIPRPECDAAHMLAFAREAR